MFSISLNNWTLGLRLFTTVLLMAATAGTFMVLKSVEVTRADLDLSTRRCLLGVPQGIDLEGFSPVSESVFYRAEQIHLGPGKLILDDGSTHDANQVTFLLTKNLSSSVVRISGPDLAVGRFSTGSGQLEIQSPEVGGLRFNFTPDQLSAGAKGEISLGDSCIITATGYDLVINGNSDAKISNSLSAVFLPWGGVGHFLNKSGGLGFQFSLVDFGFDLSKPIPITGARFLNENSQCAGVYEGSIRVGSNNFKTDVLGDSCIRLQGQDLRLRHLSMGVHSSEMNVALSGRFHSLELNATKLIARPVWIAVFIGLGIFLVFGALIIGAKKLFTPKGQY